MSVAEGILLGILQHSERRVTYHAEVACPRIDFLAQMRLGLAEKFGNGPAAPHLEQMRADLAKISGQERDVVHQLYLAHASLRRSALAILGLESDAVRFEADTQSPSDGLAWVEGSLRIFHQVIDPSTARPEANALLALINGQAMVHGWETSDFFYPLRGPSEGSGSQTRVVVNDLRDLTDQFKVAGSRIRLQISYDSRLAEGLPSALRAILDLPDPEGERGLWRMPVRQRYRDVSVYWRDQSPLVRFDESGRLVVAPSLGGTDTISGVPVHDVVTIGAGPGGIAAGVELASRGIFDQVILEGGSRPLSMIYELYPPGKAVDKDYKGNVEPPEGIIGVEDSSDTAFYRRLESFVNFYHLPIFTEQRVTAIRRENGFYIVRTEGGGLFAARHLILAAGRLHKPRLHPRHESWPPEVQARVLPASGRAVNLFAGRRVLVVGGGQTAFNMVQALVASGSDVTLSYRGANFGKNLPPAQEAVFTRWESEGRIRILRGTNIKEIGEGLSIHFEEPQEPLTNIDGVIVSFGYKFDPTLLQIPGEGPLQATEEGIVRADGTPLPNFYPVGDFVATRSVMVAINRAVRAVRTIAASLPS